MFVRPVNHAFADFMISRDIPNYTPVNGHTSVPNVGAGLLAGTR